MRERAVTAAAERDRARRAAAVDAVSDIPVDSGRTRPRLSPTVAGMDPLDLFAQPRCPFCRTVLHTRGPAFECRSCGLVFLSPRSLGL